MAAGAGLQPVARRTSLLASPLRACCVAACWRAAAAVARRGRCDLLGRCGRVPMCVIGSPEGRWARKGAREPAFTHLAPAGQQQPLRDARLDCMSDQLLRGRAGNESVACCARRTPRSRLRAVCCRCAALLLLVGQGTVLLDVAACHAKQLRCCRCQRRGKAPAAEEPAAGGGLLRAARRFSCLVIPLYGSLPTRRRTPRDRQFSVTPSSAQPQQSCGCASQAHFNI